MYEKQIGKMCEEIHEILHEVCGVSAVSFDTVYRWLKCFYQEY